MSKCKSGKEILHLCSGDLRPSWPQQKRVKKVGEERRKPVESHPS